MQVWQLTMGDFQQISLTRYNSKTIEDRRTVSVKGNYEVVGLCVLSNGDIADYLD